MSEVFPRLEEEDDDDDTAEGSMRSELIGVPDREIRGEDET